MLSDIGSDGVDEQTLGEPRRRVLAARFSLFRCPMVSPIHPIAGPTVQGRSDSRPLEFARRSRFPTGSGVQIMLDANDPDAPVSPVFVVDSIEAFHVALPSGLTTLNEPSEIPWRIPRHMVHGIKVPADLSTRS